MNLITRFPNRFFRRTLGLLRGRGGAPSPEAGDAALGLRRPIVIGALAVLVIGLGVTWSLLQNDNHHLIQQKELNEALAKLDAHDFEGARRIAGRLREQDLSFRRMGGPVYILGAALYHDAEEHSDPAERKNLYLIASRYLEEARDRSFPPGRNAHGALLLGTAMFHAERYADCIPVLQKALKFNPSQRVTIHRFLAEAYERDLARQYDKSLEHIQQYLNEKVLAPADRLEGLVLQARVSLHRGRQLSYDSPDWKKYLDTCSQALAEVHDIDQQRQTSHASEGDQLLRRRDRLVESRIEELLNQAAVIETQLLMQRALMAETAAGDESSAEARQYLEQARDRLRQLEQQGRSTGAAEYLLGHILRRLGDLPAAREQFDLAMRRRYGSPEGFAAELEQAEVLRELGDHAASIAIYINVLNDVGDPAQFANPWVDELDRTHNGDELEEVRRRIMLAHAEALEAQRFADAEQLAEHLEPLFAPDRALQTRAETQAVWADHLDKLAGELAASQARTARDESVERYRTAGEAFRSLADLRFTSREYTDILWRSAESFLRGNDYRSASEMIEKYLGQEPRRRRPRALTMLGNAQLGMNELEAAATTFAQCLAAYPKDPDSYQARLGAAKTACEMGRLDDAVKLLAENLQNASLTPQSLDWRHSLFLLAETHYRQGLEVLTRTREFTDASVLDEATRKNVQRDLEQAAKLLGEAALRFNEAVQRYPEDPRIMKAHYLLAESHRHRAKVPRWKLPLETIETRRVELAGQMRGEFEAASKKYDELIHLLEAKQETRELTPLELAIQRNCYFAKAHTLYDLEKYEQAVEAYSTATNRYQSEPASLEAYQQIAACYRKLGDPAKARGTIEQAKMVIANMPAEVDYQKTTRFPRDVWLDLLK